MFFLLFTAPAMLTALGKGAIAIAPPAAAWLPPGEVVVGAQAFDKQDPTVRLRSCVYLQVEPTNAGVDDGRQPSWGKLCPENLGPFTIDHMTLYPGKARATLQASVVDSPLETTLVVPWGTTTQVTVVIDAIDANGSATHARLVAPPPPDAKDRLFDALAALGVLFAIASCGAMLVGLSKRWVTLGAVASTVLGLFGGGLGWPAHWFLFGLVLFYDLAPLRPGAELRQGRSREPASQGDEPKGE